jgi:hypothetical protein
MQGSPRSIFSISGTGLKFKGVFYNLGLIFSHEAAKEGSEHLKVQ